MGFGPGACSTAASLAATAEQAMAPEHVIAVLHAIDLDLDEYITLHDLRAFASRHRMPFDDDTLDGMFREANYTGDGLIDSEQLAKAVSAKFARRKHNDDWRLLFQLAPQTASAARLTVLPAVPPMQEPIRAGFEQVEDICTFSPRMWNRSGCGSAGLASAGCDMPPPLSPRRPRPHSPPPANDPGLARARAAEAEINELLRPEAPSAAAADGAAHCSFAAKRAFAAQSREAQIASESVGWRARLTEGAAALAPPPPPPVHGLHAREWQNRLAKRAPIPVRLDGTMSRVGPYVLPPRWQATCNIHPATLGSRDAPLGVAGKAEFRSRMRVNSRFDDKMAVSNMSLSLVGTKPVVHEERDDDRPEFKLRLGVHWPKHEERPPTALF